MSRWFFAFKRDWSRQSYAYSTPQDTQALNRNFVKFKGKT